MFIAVLLMSAIIILFYLHPKITLGSSMMIQEFLYLRCLDFRINAMGELGKLKNGEVSEVAQMLTS